MAATVIAFDVNETLLDTAALDPLFERWFGDAAARQEWFSRMLQLALVGELTGRHVDFGTAQRGALRMLGAARRVQVGDDEAEAVTTAMTRLPPHPEVRGALERLRAGGLRLLTLSNSPPGPAREQIVNAGLDGLVEATLSAEDAGALKPSPQPYRMAAERAGVPIGGLRLVAAHGWDVSGALAAGCAAAFVARSGAVPSPIGPQPDIVGADLDEVAGHILDAR